MTIVKLKLMPNSVSAIAFTYHCLNIIKIVNYMVARNLSKMRKGGK